MPPLYCTSIISSMFWFLSFLNAGSMSDIWRAVLPRSFTVLSFVKKHGLSPAEVPRPKNAMMTVSSPPVDATAVSMAFTTASRLASAERSSLARSAATPRYFLSVSMAWSALASLSAVGRGLIALSVNSPTPTITMYGPCAFPFSASRGWAEACEFGPTAITSAAIAPKNHTRAFIKLFLLRPNPAGLF